MRIQITGVILAGIYTANARLFDLKDFSAFRMDCGWIGIQVRVDNFQKIGKFASTSHSNAEKSINTAVFSINMKKVV